jgi:uncharacterized protein YhaN
MRLRRLDLTRYGKFTDHSIDFGARPEGYPDLHVIYGPNEAGKSTAFTGFLDLLFGIGTQSPFDFLHPYSTMRIGGALEFGAETREFARIKRPQNSLLDAEDRPILESAIRGELGGIERDAYRTMFSLDDETLEKGGESILASRGDLGQLLFSASAGLAHLSDKLLDLKGEADGFYKYRARSGALTDLKSCLAELKAEREQFDTLASDHARLVETRDRSKAHYDEAVTERTLTHGRVNEIQGYLVALPRLTALRGLREQLGAVADVPEAPSGWASELPGLQKDEIELGVQTSAVAEEVGRLEDEIATIAVDEDALRLAERVEELAELRARHVTAETDIPERRLQLREIDRAISAILQLIEREGEAEPLRLLLTATTVGRLRELIEARSGIDAALQNAAKELGEARRRLGEAAEKASHDGDDAQAALERDRSIAELAITVEALRSTDHHVRHRVADRTRTAALEALADRLSGLRPWQGTADDLFGMPCPAPDRVQRWKARRADAEAALARHQSEIERLMTQVRHLEAECAGLASVTGVVTDQEAAEIRTRREQAWALHRHTLDLATADAFEAALRRDDIVGAGHFSHMSELAKLHQSRQALAVAHADLERAIELKDAAAAALARLEAEVTEAVHAMSSSFASLPSLPELEGWLTRRERALEAGKTVRSAERDVHQAQSDAAAATARLRAALNRVGQPEPEADFNALLANAQSLLDREADLRRLRANLDDRQRDVASRERAAVQAEAADKAWAEAWSVACRGCWLGEASDAPAIGVVREILSALADLAPAIEKRAGLVDRIGKMKKDQAAFREEVMALAGILDVPVGTGSVLELAHRFGGKIRHANAESDRRKRTVDRLEQAKGRQRSLAEKSAIHEEQKRRMTAFFGVESLAEVAGCLSDVARRFELGEQAEAAEREILEAARAPDLLSAEAALAAADRWALEAELIDLKARFEDQDRRSHELFAAWSAARNEVEAIGGDARVAAIEERRRTTLLEIEDGAMRYLQLRAGIAATEQALAIYRERHRSSMMTRASAAFRTISRGAYTGLAAQPGKDGEMLIALSAGGSKAANELSKGTRFQLYLALRVAGYHEFVQARSAVPFVADDIMETFDDFRAEEAFRLFADMAGDGQVIYLTHHQHLCEIVQRVCPMARLHSLDDSKIERWIA